MKAEYKPGSFAIEASFVVPMALFAVLLVIDIGLYQYDRAVCTYACYIGSRTVAAAGGREAQAVIEEQKKQLQEQLVCAEDVELRETQDGERYTVTVSARMEIPFFGKKLSIHEEQWHYRLDHRDYILRYAAVIRRLVGNNLE